MTEDREHRSIQTRQETGSTLTLKNCPSFFFFFQITSEVFYGNGKGHVNPGEAGSLINVGIFKVQTESFQIPGIEVISRKHLFICVMIHHCLESIVLGG